MCPAKSVPDGAESGGAGKEEPPGFTKDLLELYLAAGGGTPKLSYRTLHSELLERGREQGYGKVPFSTFTSWMKDSVPHVKNTDYVLKVLIPHLEEHARRRSDSHRRVPNAAWRARLEAAQGKRRSGQGGHGPRIRASSPGRLFGDLATLKAVVPREFVGRREELAQLEASVTSPAGRGPDYILWQADAWAGKTALLAWFADRCLPVGVDLVHYFIAGRLGTATRKVFFHSMTRYLAAVAGKKPAIVKGHPDTLDEWEMRATLHRLYEQAAHASAKRHRAFVLLVDGLDEDADAGLGRRSIAALLPKVPPPGMRVIVSRRPNPSTPEDVLVDHPLRDSAIVHRLTASPAAQVIRETARQELRALLDDPDVGSPLLGLLTVAQGALSGKDLAELVKVRPDRIDKVLGSVVGRSMQPDDSDHLALAPKDELTRQTYVLAHDELRLDASDALGNAELAEYKARLHTWAAGYQAQNWPEETPTYLLTGYTRLVHGSADAQRLASLVLDPLRQLRIVERSGVDVALADLDLTVTMHPGHTPQSLAVLAGAAAARELLLRHARPLPYSIPRAVARLGHAQRARALALASADPSAKAASLAQVARVLADTSHEQAQQIAQEAADWAHKARRRTMFFVGGHEDTEAIAAQAAVALIATRQESDGIKLLRSTRGLSTTRYEAWVDAVTLLFAYLPAVAAQLLDEMEEEAEDLACDSAFPEDRAVPIQIWAILAAAFPERADRLHDRIVSYSQAVWAELPALTSVGVLTTAASALVDARQEEAAALAALAKQYIESQLQDSASLSVTDHSHLHFGLQAALAGLMQALADTGVPMEERQRLLDSMPEQLRTGFYGHDVTASARSVIARGEKREPGGGSGFGDDNQTEAEKQAHEAFHLAELGKHDAAKRHLGEALALLPESHPDGRSAIVWLPALLGALVRGGRASDAEALIAELHDSHDLARAFAAVALAHADSGRIASAREQAHEAARAARAVLDPVEGDAAGAWAIAAQALAGAGEGSAALELIEQAEPVQRAGKAAWRRASRRARIAVASELAVHDPVLAARLIDEERQGLLAGKHRPRGLEGLLADLVGLLPAADALKEPYKAQLDQAIREALAYISEPPQAWKAETVLAHALLEIKEGGSATRQMGWLNRESRARRAERFPGAGLAVVHAVCNDVCEAWKAADELSAPESRAAAFAAVGAYLVQLPVRVPPIGDPADTDPFAHTIRALALTVSTPALADREAAVRFTRQALTTGAGWHHALAILSRIAPEAIVQVQDIVGVHLRIKGTATAPLSTCPGV